MYLSWEEVFAIDNTDKEAEFDSSDSDFYIYNGMYCVRSSNIAAIAILIQFLLLSNKTVE